MVVVGLPMLVLVPVDMLPSVRVAALCSAAFNFNFTFMMIHDCFLSATCTIYLRIDIESVFGKSRSDCRISATAQ